MSNLLTQFGSWLAVGTVIVLGLVALFGIFDKRRGEIKKDENDTEDRLIKLFKEERDQLNKRVDDQNKLIGDLEKKVDKMTHENELLIAVLQGKDEASKQFQKDAYESMAKLNVLLDLGKVNNENITKLITLMDRRMEITKPTP